MTGGRVIYEKKQGGGDDTGLNGLQIQCASSGWYTVHNGHWGAWKSHVTYSRYRVIGARVRYEKKQGSGDDTAMNGIKFLFRP